MELPIGATEDRVIGSLDLQKVLRDGEHAFSPGLLARAHGGVLYVDEVNLLPDHLVDVLLDAAAMGRVHIERDGVSHSHEARFVLVGTMNPEEGELRPQLLDRFGLAVDVQASRDVRGAQRGDPRAAGLRGRPGRVRRSATPSRTPNCRSGSRRRANALAAVVLPDGELHRIAALCAAFDVDGMRADLVVARTAVAHAAWRGAPTVEAEDIRAAAELALPHRRRRDPFDDPGIDPGQLDEALRQAGPPRPEPGSRSARPAMADSPLVMPRESPGRQRNSSSAPRPAAPPAATFRTRALTVPGVGDGRVGPPVGGPQRRRCGGASESDTRAGPRRAPVRHAARRRRTPQRAAVRCARRPATCAGRYGWAGRATW